MWCNVFVVSYFLKCCNTVVNITVCKSRFTAVAASMHVGYMAMIVVVCSNISPVGYNYRYCATAKNCSNFAPQWKTQTHSFLVGNRKKRVTHWGLVKAERQSHEWQGVQLISVKLMSLFFYQLITNMLFSPPHPPSTFCFSFQNNDL